MPTAELPVRERSCVALYPKNSGFAAQLARLRERYPLPGDASSLSVRGEDVAFFANELARLDRRVLAFTGDDLLDEWLARGNALDRRLIRRRIAWSDPAAIYGAPALCLIGASQAVLSDPRPLRVMVCSRYLRTTERFLRALRGDGLVLDALPVGGSLETCVASGLADLIVDIVVERRDDPQSRSARAAGDLDQRRCGAGVALVPGRLPDYDLRESTDFGARLRVHRNESPLPPPEHVVAAVRSIDADALRYYPASLSRSVAKALASRLEVRPRNVVLCNGADEALLALARVSLGRGDNVVTLRPSFGMYARAAGIAGAQVRELRYARRWTLDPEALLRLADARTRLVFLGHPNNPTGETLAPETLLLLARSLPNALIAVDEIYLSFRRRLWFATPGRRPTSSRSARFRGFRARRHAGRLCRRRSGRSGFAAARHGALSARRRVARRRRRVPARRRRDRAFRARREPTGRAQPGRHRARPRALCTIRLAWSRELHARRPRHRRATGGKEPAAPRHRRAHVLRPRSRRLPARVRLGRCGNRRTRGRLAGNALVRTGRCKRATTETTVSATIGLDVRGRGSIATGAIMLDHLLGQFAFHSGCELESPPFRTIRSAITSSKTSRWFSGARLGGARERRGIARFGSAVIPMDDALARAAVDLGGRAYARTEFAIEAERVEGLDTVLLPHFFRSLAGTAGLTVHLDVLTAPIRTTRSSRPSRRLPTPAARRGH